MDEQFEWKPVRQGERWTRWALAGLLLVILVGLQVQTYRLTTGLRETQQQRCAERNADTQVLVDFVGRQAPALADQLRVQLVPRDCGVYDQ